MAKLFRPTLIVDGNAKEYPTYSEVKRNLKNILIKSEEKEVSVYRSRRGEWGEWFEKWKLNYANKPVKVREGWM